MPLQVLTLELEGITADDYLTWCRDPEPPALGWALSSIAVAADPLGDTVTATLTWNQPAPEPRAAAIAAGLPVAPGVRVGAAILIDAPHPEAPAISTVTRRCLSAPG